VIMVFYQHKHQHIVILLVSGTRQRDTTQVQRNLRLPSASGEVESGGAKVGSGRLQEIMIHAINSHQLNQPTNNYSTYHRAYTLTTPQ